MGIPSEPFDRHPLTRVYIFDHRIKAKMPRQVAPPPSGEFTIYLQKPFAGQPTHTVNVVGEPNRPAVIRQTMYNGSTKSSEKSGDVPKVDFNTFEIQWSNVDEDPTAGEVSEIAAEQKDDFKRVADSIEALARTFAKRDAAV